MPKKKAKISEAHSDTPLVGAARSFGSTLGTVAAKAEETAKDIEVFTQSVRNDAASATDSIYKRAKKSVRAGAATWKAGVRKRKASKARAGKSPGRRK
jgi:tRNA A-37 threonylcarbamoyl transferase component Bud32